MIEISQLQVLIAVETSDTLIQAAEKLGITQSAVSQQLKAIDLKVGFSAVTKVGKKIVLTPEGKRLAKMGRTFIKKFEVTIDEIQAENHQIIGEVRLGTLNGIGKSWIANRMIDYSALFPDLKVEVCMDFPEVLIKRFENFELDCLVLPEELTPHHCDSKILHEEHATLIFPDSHDFNITEKTTLKEITDFPLIFFEEKDPLFFQWCRNKFGSIPRLAKPRLIMNSFGNMMYAVKQGLGICVIPTHVLRRSSLKNELKTLGKEHDFLSSRFKYIINSDDSTNYKLQSLFDFLRKEVDHLDV